VSTHKNMPGRRALRAMQAFAICAVAIVAVACKSEGEPQVQKPVNTADPAGTGLTAEQQIQRIQNNPNFTPEQKQKMIELTKRRAGMSGPTHP